MTTIILTVALLTVGVIIAECKCPAEYGFMCLAGNSGKRSSTPVEYGSRSLGYGGSSYNSVGDPDNNPLMRLLETVADSKNQPQGGASRRTQRLLAMIRDMLSRRTGGSL